MLNLSFQAALGKVAADEDVIWKAAGIKRTTSQISHQSGYVKNKIYQLIGLQHTVTFDQNAGFILNELIKKSAAELAEIYLGEIPFSSVVQDFQERVNKELQASGKPVFKKGANIAHKPAIGMMQIIEVLQEQIKPTNDDWLDSGDDGKGPGTRYFTFDEYGTPTGITPLSAALLLIAVHYGKEVIPS